LAEHFLASPEELQKLLYLSFAVFPFSQHRVVKGSKSTLLSSFILTDSLKVSSGVLTP